MHLHGGATVVTRSSSEMANAMGKRGSSSLNNYILRNKKYK